MPIGRKVTAPNTYTGINLKKFGKCENDWSVPIVAAVIREPGCCLLATVCPCAVNYAIRKEALVREYPRARKKGKFPEDYECCQNFYCKSCIDCVPIYAVTHGQCRNTCTPCCLAAETVICPLTSIMATRHFMQQKFSIRNTGVENVCVDCLQWVDGLLCCIDEKNRKLHDCLCLPSHLVYHLSCACASPCLQAQMHHELQTRASAGGSEKASTSAPAPTAPAEQEMDRGIHNSSPASAIVTQIAQQNQEQERDAI